MKETTPRDLLHQYGFEYTKDVQPGKCYIKGIFMCDSCRREIEFLDEYDEAIYHECNRGNVVSYPKINRS